MAGKGLILVFALFVVVQTTPIFQGFDELSCPSRSSLKVNVKENECTRKQDCHHSRLVCCENEEKVNVCAEGVYSSVINNSNSDKVTAVASKSTKSTSDLNKSGAVLSESNNGQNRLAAVASKSTKSTSDLNKSGAVLSESNNGQNRLAAVASKSTKSTSNLNKSGAVLSESDDDDQVLD